MENLYQLLGVSETATLQEVKSAYKSLAKAFHPDINPSKNAEEQFKKITAAYTVLSNQQLRQQYDLKLAQMRLNAMRASMQAQETRKRSYQYQARSYPFGHQNPQRKNSYDPELERKGTFYAVGMIASIAILLYISTSIYNFYQEKKLENLMTHFDDQVHRADSLYYAGKIQAALNFIQEIKAENLEKGVIKRYEINYLNFRKDQADIDYKNHSFQDALWGYLFFMEYSGKQNLDMQYYMANCYRQLNQANKAIFILNQLMNENYRRMRMIELIADIYKSDIQDSTLALKYYNMGLSNILSQYKSVYGEAYRLLVSAEKTPDSYKAIYFGAAEILYMKQDYLEASKLLEWSIFFEPQKPIAYGYLINCYLQLNQKNDACSTAKKAKKQALKLPQISQLNCI